MRVITRPIYSGVVGDLPDMCSTACKNITSGQQTQMGGAVVFILHSSQQSSTQHSVLRGVQITTSAD